MRTTRFLAFAAAGVLAGTGIAACGNFRDSDEATSADGPIAVRAHDTACDVGRTDLGPARPPSRSPTRCKVTEFYVYAAGDRVMGEVENIAPGLSRELRVNCPPGRRDGCKPG
jgi:iron uptake system component EfeO